MTPNRYDAKVDANQAEIVAALRAVGASVYPLHTVGRGFPDIAVGYRGQNYFLEIKTGKGKLTLEEQEFFDTWQGRAGIVRSVEEALAFIGATEEAAQ